MRLFVDEDQYDPEEGGYVTVTKHNPHVDYVCYCSNPDCRGYGTRSQYGRDYICNECGEPLDWSNERKW
jgi:predicted SprT family Zn-dependent metalloprotease